MTPAELALLEASTADRPVALTTDCALYACCGRGWQLREGYEQTYHGYAADMTPAGGGEAGRVRLVSPGIGTISYQVVVSFSHVHDVVAL